MRRHRWPLDAGRHFEHPAFFRFFGDDRWSTFSAFQYAFDILEDQFAFIDSNVVAGDAFGVQNEVLVTFEINWSPQFGIFGGNGSELVFCTTDINRETDQKGNRN